MSKWNKEVFIKTVKSNCVAHTSSVIVELINFSESNADNLSWGKGSNCGTMTFKCKSEDYGFLPLFNISPLCACVHSAGQIKVLPVLGFTLKL